VNIGEADVMNGQEKGYTTKSSKILHIVIYTQDADDKGKSSKVHFFHNKSHTELRSIKSMAMCEGIPFLSIII
jgi:hypothetical protein